MQQGNFVCIFFPAATMENLLSMGRLDVNVGAEKIQDQSHHPSRIKLVLCNCVSYPEHSALMSFYRSYRQLW